MHKGRINRSVSALSLFGLLLVGAHLVWKGIA